MMKSKLFILLAVLFLGVCPASTYFEIWPPEPGAINFSDGQTHNIDYVISIGASVDYQAPQMHTTVNLLEGGSVENFFYGCENGRINVRGGEIYSLTSYDYSQISISGGSIHYLLSRDSSQVNITGGSIDGYLFLCDQSIIRIFGSDFAVDGQPFGYGELTSISGSIPWFEPTRHLTGTLLSGELIDNNFYIGSNAKIILIPEPASAMILGLGSLIVYYRRRR